MDRAGARINPLTTEELLVVFEIVRAVKGRKDLILRLPERNRNTLYRAYDTVSRFEREKLIKLDDAKAKEIAEATSYSATASYVQNIFRQWLAWCREQNLPAGNSLGQPALYIEFDLKSLEDLGPKTINGEIWQVACPRCLNTGLSTAKDCLATAVMISGYTYTGSRGPFYLNPVDEAYTLQRDSATPINITPGKHRSWDLVFAPKQSVQTETPVTSGPVNITTFPIDKALEEIDRNKGGACIAIPIAMTRKGVPQGYLVPGSYLLKMEVSDATGVKASAFFRVQAPIPGGVLEVLPVTDKDRQLIS